MRVTRFCSRAEFEKYDRGEVLVNHTDHYRGGSGGSTSVGFCFTADPPRKAWRYLKGIVDFDVCMVLDIDKSLLAVSNGKYLDYSHGGYASCLKTEFCLQTYSKRCAKLVKLLHPPAFATPSEIYAASLFMQLKKIDPDISND